MNVAYPITHRTRGALVELARVRALETEAGQMSDAFTRFAAALALSPAAQTTGRIDGAAASAYVWGWQDGRGEDKDTEPATTFGLLYGEMSALYAAEKLPWKDNIGSAFKHWQETGEVMTPDQREYLHKHL